MFDLKTVYNMCYNKRKAMRSFTIIIVLALVLLAESVLAASYLCDSTSAVVPDWLLLLLGLNTFLLAGAGFLLAGSILSDE